MWFSLIGVQDQIVTVNQVFKCLLLSVKTHSCAWKPSEHTADKDNNTVNR